MVSEVNAHRFIPVTPMVRVIVHRQQAGSYWTSRTELFLWGKGLHCPPEKCKQRKTCRSRLAGDGLKYAEWVQTARVIVNDDRQQAGSYRRGNAVLL